MAGEELLALLSPQDLQQFQNSVIQSSPSYMGAQAIGAWNPDMSTWSGTAQGLGSFGKAFLSGVLSNYARQDAANQLSSLVTALPQLKADPLHAAVPEGVNADAFAPIRGVAYLNQLKNEQRRAEKMEDLRIGGLAKYLGKNLEIQGEQDAYAAMGAGDPNAGNLMSPVEKTKRELEKNAQDALKSAPQVTNFADLKTNFDAMKENYKFNTKPATLAFVSSFARVLDPGSVVREGEIKNAENTQSFFSGLGYNLQSLLNGTQSISPETKQQMLQSAAAKYNTFGKDFQRYLSDQQDFVERLGARRQNVFAPTVYEPFDFDAWRGTAKQETSAGTPVEQLQAIKEELQAGASPERVIELRNRAMEIKNSLAPKTGKSGVPLG